MHLLAKPEHTTMGTVFAILCTQYVQQCLLWDVKGYNHPNLLIPAGITW